MRQKNVIAVAGPTASGKTGLSLSLAKRFDGEIISADSMQIYKGMDIGTAKATPKERDLAVHHLVDIADFWENYSAAKFVKKAHEAINDIAHRGKMPIIVGGTGQYVSGILDGIQFADMENDLSFRQRMMTLAKERGEAPLRHALFKVDPQSAERILPNDVKRLVRALEIYHVTGKTQSYFNEHSKPESPPYHPCILVLTYKDRALLYKRIEERVELMFSEGLADEVRALMEKGFGREDTTSLKAIGYAQTISYLNGECTLEQAKQTIKKLTRNYAKRQLTWWRKESRAHMLEVDTMGGGEELVSKACEIIENTFSL